MFIYVLQLEQNKYYIGKTTNIEFRLEDHFTSNGAAWTRKYKPIRVESIIADCDDFDEDKYTLKYMEKYGINNVRGGSFCEIKLSDSNIITLNQIMNSVTDKCYICGDNGHFANECKKDKKNKDDNEKCNCVTSYYFPHRTKKCGLAKAFEVVETFYNEEEDIEKLKLCRRCGRNNHIADNCFAKTHLNGYKIVT
jgi:hypothetical protein